MIFNYLIIDTITNPNLIAVSCISRRNRYNTVGALRWVREIKSRCHDVTVFSHRFRCETQQPLSKRVHQHTHSAAGRPNSAVLDHMCETGHVLDLDSFTILEREADWRRRGIREAIYVKRVVPGLNKSGGLRCALSPVWDRPLGVKSVRASRPEDGLGIGRN